MKFVPNMMWRKDNTRAMHEKMGGNKFEITFCTAGKPLNKNSTPLALTGRIKIKPSLVDAQSKTNTVSRIIVPDSIITRFSCIIMIFVLQ